MKNKGKVFEEDFKKSVPSYCFCHRLKDSAMAYNNSKQTKFTWDNPCDFFVFNSTSHLFYAIELKSTKYKSMTYATSKEEDEGKNKKMIKYHQLESLRKLAEYDGIYAGLLLNFRDEESGYERTYYISIERFDAMCKRINKGSFNEIDLIQNFALKVNGQKKRVHYRWDIGDMLSDIPAVI